MIHDFPDAVGFFFRRRRPPPWGWCGLSFFFVEPHGLPLFFADPLDITIWAPYTLSGNYGIIYVIETEEEKWDLGSKGE
jgi:hypothetical protein